MLIFVVHELLSFKVYSCLALLVTLLRLASPQCVQGFLNEEAVRIAVDVYATSNIYSVRSHEGQQRVIPDIKFTCNGTLTKWIIGAQRTLIEDTNPQHLQLQIWRRQGSSNRYHRSNFSDMTTLNATDDLNVYEYIPNPPLQFQAQDILGLYLPHISDTQVEVYYQRGGGPRNFRRSDQNSPLTSIRASGEGDNDLPLVAVEVSGKMNSFHCPMQENEYCFCYVACLFRREC